MALTDIFGVLQTKTRAALRKRSHKTGFFWPSDRFSFSLRSAGFRFSLTRLIIKLDENKKQ